jgi:hypothetical protein
MTNEAFQLTVFRRSGELWVSPAVLSATGFQALNGVIPVRSPEQLATALREATDQATAAQSRPRETRFPQGTSYWEAAGVPSFEEFLAGLVACVILRYREETVIEYWETDRRGKMLEIRKTVHEGPPDMPLDEVARIVRGVLEPS